MIALLQRVTEASVIVDDAAVARIGTGLLVLVGVERGDTGAQAKRLAERLLGYRVFPDDDARMNLGIREIGGALLLVPQFTLAADTAKGMRPGFGAAADPDTGVARFEELVSHARAGDVPVETGAFGAHMQVHLTNDGPVTFHLRVPPPAG